MSGHPYMNRTGHNSTRSDMDMIADVAIMFHNSAGVNENILSEHGSWTHDGTG
jgi:hypothetical protein